METDDSDAHTGSKSFKIIADDLTGTATQAQVRHDPVPVETGKTYTMAFWAKVDAEEAQSREVTLVARTDLDAYEGFFNKDFVLDSTDWKEYEVTFVADMMTPGDVFITLAIAQSDVNFWIDGLRFFEGMPDDEITGPSGVKGDVDGDGELGSDDAIMGLRIVAGLVTPTEEQKWAADVNEDGSFGSNDVILILRRIVGLGAPGMGMMAGADGQITITLAEAHGVAGESITVPVDLDSVNGLAGGDVCIVYDSEVLRAVDVLSDANVLLAGNTAEPGIIRISFASAGGLSSRTLAMIRFDVFTDDVSPLTIKRAELYGPDALPLISRVIDQQFTSWAMPPKRSALLQNFPNPFNPETWIPYQLRKDSEVTIRIFNVRGDLVRELELGYMHAGLYVSRDRAAYWDGRNEAGETVGSGVYFYSIQAGDLAAVKKLTVLR